MTHLHSYARRQFFAQSVSALGGLGALWLPTMPSWAQSSSPLMSRITPNAKIVVIGGGFGGATAAKYLHEWSQGALDITLIEPNPLFISCPLSNMVLSGVKSLAELSFGYDKLKQRGIRVVTDWATDIDPVRQQVRTQQQGTIAYDRLIVSPGIDFDVSAIAGLADSRLMQHHAWKAGAQTVALREQLVAMPDGATFILSIPKAPYRCPPGPYERACQVAWYFKQYKPRCKVVILDANDDIVSKKGLFSALFNGVYADVITYHKGAQVTEVDATQSRMTLELGEQFGGKRGDVLNIIPPQRAGQIAQRAGLVTANQRWCGVDWRTMASIAVPNVHVLGDSTLAAPLMPKSGHMANQHAKTAAAAMIADLQGVAAPEPMMVNTCYSFVDHQQAVHVASVHRYNATSQLMEVVQGSGGLSAAPNPLEFQYGLGWAQNIWADALV